jgi:primosomal protein N' (replication factor Y)
MQQTVQVLVDEPAIDREFTYLLPPELSSGRVPVTVGTMVRVVLNRRRLRGWVTGLNAPMPADLELAPISGVVGVGPPPHVVELARWAAWRWAGTRAHFLRTASPDRVVGGVPAGSPATLPSATSHDGIHSPGWVRDAFGAGAGVVGGEPQCQVGLPELPDRLDLSAAVGDDQAADAVARSAAAGRPPGVVRLGPCSDEWPLVVEALRRGRVLLLVPNVAWAARLSGRLRESGITTALAPRDWAGAATAHAVVGTRSAVWAPCESLDTVIVFDEHDEAHQSEAAPTWNARDVAVERARRDGARCLLVGPMPSPDALMLAGHAAAAPDAGSGPDAGGHSDPGSRAGSDVAASPPVISAAKPLEREAWPRVHIADRRLDDPATGEWCSEALAELLRSDRTVVCVLNRTGRARLAYCASCGELATSRDTGQPLRLEKQQFVDPDSGEVRPAVCEACGALRFRRARVGVKGVAEEMERLARRPVIQIVGAVSPDAPAAAQRTVRGATRPTGRRAGQRSGDGRPQTPRHVEAPPLYIGTEAVLHRVPSADGVAFVDFDQELMAPRYRAAEEAFALLVRAARLVGLRSSGGSILVQTRLPDHPVLAAAAGADPSDWVRAEAERRTQMRQPPASAWALVSGAAAPGYIGNVSAGRYASALDIAGPADGTWRIRSDDRDVLLDALAEAERPSGRLRVAVDPLRA